MKMKNFYKNYIYEKIYKKLYLYISNMLVALLYFRVIKTFKYNN